MKSEPMSSDRQLRRMRDLGISEIVFGGICIVVGIEVAAVNGLYSKYGTIYTSGEGIWCGIWIVIAGIFGLIATKPNATLFQKKLHIVFCLIGCLFSMIMVILGVIFLIIGPNTFVIDSFFSYPVIYVFGFISFMLMIVSIVDASKLLGYHCHKADSEACNVSSNAASLRPLPFSEAATLPAIQ